MKKIVFAIIAMAALTTVSLTALEGEVVAVNGKVEYQGTGGAWKELRTGEAVTSGTMISTGFKSNATIKLGASILTVKPLTRMTLTALAEKDDVVDTELYLEVGTIKAEVNSFKNKRNGFTVKSPVATASVRGTVFEIGDRVTILQGAVLVSTNIGQSRTGSTGQNVDISGDTLNSQIVEKKRSMKPIALSSLPSTEPTSPIDVSTKDSGSTNANAPTGSKTSVAITIN